MATERALRVFLASLEAKTYYQVLGVASDVDGTAIREAFHAFSLLYHPDRYVDAAPEVGALATAIFKRGVEAYRCIGRGLSREQYDASFTCSASGPGGHPETSAPVRTLETLAQTSSAKLLARRADRLIAAGSLSQARVPLVTACQCEPDNQALSERLQMLYEALALEPT